MSNDGIARDGMRRGELMIVTGGGGGFGRAFARRFARDGAKVAVWEVNTEAGQESVQQVKAEGGEARFFAVDLSRPEQIDAAVKATLAAYGAPYCVINNASIYPRFSVIDMPLDVWEKTLKVNITAPFVIAKAFAPLMIARKRGVIINIASGRAFEATPRGANYASSKAALISLTKTLAMEWARHNIRVNAIVPGVSFTAQPLEDTTPEELIERGKQQIPLGRVGYPEDMAGLAAFLVSPDASYMTGQAIAMNGGKIMIS